MRAFVHHKETSLNPSTEHDNRIQSNKWNAQFIKQIEVYCYTTFRFVEYVQNMDRNLSSLFRFELVKTCHELLFFNPSHHHHPTHTPNEAREDTQFAARSQVLRNMVSLITLY